MTLEDVVLPIIIQLKIEFDMPYRKIIPVLIAAGLMFCAQLFGQDIKLGMTRDEFVNSFGKPESEVCTDNANQRIMLFYGDDYFTFNEGRLESLNVMSRHFALPGVTGRTIMAGDTFSSLVEAAGDQLELLYSDNSHDTYLLKGSTVKADIKIRVQRNIIDGFSVESKGAPFNKGEFSEFFNYSYKPTATVTEGSLWPSRIYALWNHADYGYSQDKATLTCCVPVVAESAIKGNYSGTECPPISRRLVITKYLDNSNRFKQSIVTIVPKAGLKPGGVFSGLVVYNNVNSGSCFAWEVYENGMLAYSKYLAASSQDDVSEGSTAYRQSRKISYVGGEDAISNADWLAISANKVSFTKLFASGQTEAGMRSEKAKYAFCSEVNPGYAEYEEQLKARAARMSAIQQIQEEPAPQAVEPPQTYDEELPAYVGDINHLRRILWLDNKPVRLQYDTREGNMGNQESKTVLMASNEDFCDYTVSMENGVSATVPPGGRDLTSIIDISGNRYYLHKGKAISKVDVNFPYALPVASGTRVKLIDDPREPFRSFVVLVKTGTPVYAMRAGRVCLTDDNESVLVCHEDGTFAAYMNVAGICVYPGDAVNPGDPIGTSGGGKLSISIFYLDANKTGSKQRDVFTHITPCIRTSEGDVKLVPGEEYVSLVDTDIITREMSAAEKRRYTKSAGR